MGISIDQVQLKNINPPEPVQESFNEVNQAQQENAVAKHELIEIIHTTKDRVPLRDALLTDAEKELNMGSLVPIQKGRQHVEQEIFH